jgi:hypothetical protein
MRGFFCVLMIFFGAAATTFAQHYLFSLHGKIVEDQGAHAYDSVNGFGAYQYEDICNAFRNQEFTVITEYRKHNTDVKEYAHKVAGQVDSLLHLGVKPAEISVLGASKGALIAMLVCSYVKNPAINFIFLSSCNDYVYNGMPEINFCGNILSIYEKSDVANQSCERFKNRSELQVPHFKEVALNTGLRHGYLYKPLPEWVKPAAKWAKGNYE